ncbi:uncharacterized protein LOC127715054 [Mytilus californianus]|uniref:uncharacterized protein LOC127715054 n=1 Tax=Mytilus californianus TaxID=6549 RepID=UPI00224534C5|nr:uncharacterized protein LOC127715054 [Mytilus californianus]
MDNNSNSKQSKLILASTLNFGRHRDTFRISRNNQDRNKLKERIKELEDKLKIQQSVREQMEKLAISTERQLKDKRQEIEYFERTIERLQTDCKGFKLNLESEQVNKRRLESRMQTSKNLEEEYMELYSTIEQIKKETDDSEKRLQENPGFHTQELILMNRLKELLGRMQTNGNYEFNSTNQRTIKSYNINNSQVFFNNKSLIRHGNSDDC